MNDDDDCKDDMMYDFSNCVMDWLLALEMVCKWFDVGSMINE